MEHSFLGLLLISIVQVGYLVGVYVVVGLLLGLIEKRSNHYLTKSFGYKGILATAWIGTPIHELGHALMCLVFRHKIVKIKLLQLHDPNGTLGYVNHSYDKKSIYQRVGLFFIGLAPVFSGILAIIICMYFLIPSSYQVLMSYITTNVKSGEINLDIIQNMFNSSFMLLKSLFTFQNFTSLTFWIFVLLAISISSHIALSKADMKGSAEGLCMLFGLVFLMNMVAGFIGVDTADVIRVSSQYNVYFLAFSSVAFAFSLFTLLVSYLLYLVKRSPL